VADRRKYFDPEILAKIERLDLKARMIVEGYISGLHKSPFHGFSVEFAQHREYAPGDDLRRIDWKVYARSDRHYIKEYEEETNLVAYVALDISESMRGLVLFDENVRKVIPDSSNPGHREQLIAALEAVEPTEKTDLGKALEYVGRQLKRRGMVIVISDLFGDIARLLAGLKLLRYRGHDVIVFHILDKDELEFPFQELTLFKGMEGYPDLFAEPRALRQQYLQELDAFVRRVREECVGNRIDYQQLSTAEPLDVALSSYLATRMASSVR